MTRRRSFKIESLVAEARRISELTTMNPPGSKGKPYGYERIDSPTDGINFRIHDKADDRVGTCGNEEDAKILVALLNNPVSHA